MLENTAETMRRRPRLSRRLSSIELTTSQENNSTRKGTVVSLSISRTSTFALVTSIFCAYAWQLVAAVGASSLTATLIESADVSLLSLEEETVTLQESLEEIRLGTMLSRLDLGGSRSAGCISSKVGDLSLVPPMTFEIKDFL